jgi:hypothetical protein
VAPVSVNSKLCYQLACGSKDGVPSFGPEIPEPPIFEPNDYFREFLLCKCMPFLSLLLLLLLLLSLSLSKWECFCEFVCECCGESISNVFFVVINGERAAYKSPTFAKKIQRTRLTLIKDLEEKYI